MPINLHTGTPGAGKTLRTIFEVEERRKKEGRPVYYNGIPELTLPWEELKDATTWHQLPQGAIVVIDEAQRIFPTRGGKGRPPEHIAAMETHRHEGIDLYIITQSPTFIDAHVRKLCDRHMHVMRPFGHKYAVLFEWPFVVNDPTREGMHKQALKTRWKHDAEIYKVYRSAHVHTIKSRIPFKVLLLPILALVLVGLIMWAKSALMGGREPVAGEEEKGAETPTGTPAPGVKPRPASRFVEPLAGYNLYLTGEVRTGTRVAYYVSAEKEGDAFGITAQELAAAGYLVQPLAPCIARVWWGDTHRYAVCRGRGDPQERQEGREEEGGAGVGEPSPIKKPMRFLASSKGGAE